MIRLLHSLRPAAWGALLLVGLLPLLAGCEDESLLAPEATSDTFTRYVALGNSITAGFQSGGIVNSTQDSSYAALLAEQMNTPFNIPRLASPGCPPPVDNILLSTLGLSGAPPTDCALRSSPIPTAINNVAVPFAQVIDALDNTDPASSPSELTTFILGGRTQVEAATAVRPTFASVWLGNNDALEPALAGDPGLLTDTGVFESRITRVVDSLTAAGAERGVLVSIANPRFAPHFSTGQAYAAAEPQINDLGAALAGSNWGGFSVDPSCAPGASGATTRVPFMYAADSLLAPALAGRSAELVCDPGAAPEALLTPSEQNTISARVAAYNSMLSSLADENGWVYVNVNQDFEALYAANAGDADPSNDLVPKFPNVPDPQTLAAVQDPNQDPELASTFGRYFSEDGIHPSSVTHRVVAHLVIQELNAQYDDVDLPQVSVPSELEGVLPSLQ